ncbi:MAG: LPS export ABC transporter periplasmic protein LptC [Candidatus Omnitrophica bacterium]|nr:LPS export ABC transporter periplasmic protein LptC [Candidatus Omnitrophota bacterium]MDE2222978.1 LPS export ABC transporter periplasmic protein LptC [Candidatus Omnitrophota bacterium]
MDIKLLIFSLMLVLCCAGVQADEEDSPSSPTQQLQGFNLDGYNNQGQKTWDVNGDKADITQSNIQITKVDANFYGKQQANLKADHGTINKTNGNIHLQDNVVITSKDRGTQMTTDVLDYNRNKDLVTTQAPVKIVDPQGVVTGQGLVAHPNLKNAQINKHVKATMEPPKGKGDGQVITITSDGPMQMNQAAMYAVFTDNVVAVEASTGRQLYCDKMEIWMDQATKKIKKAICTGHVKVVQGPNVSYANKMIYEGDTQMLTMIGRPKIVFDTGSTKGNGMFQPMGK